MLHVVLRQLWAPAGQIQQTWSHSKNEELNIQLDHQIPSSEVLLSNCSVTITETKNKEKVLQEHFWKGHLCLKQNHCYQGKTWRNKRFSSQQHATKTAWGHPPSTPSCEHWAPPDSYSPRRAWRACCWHSTCSNSFGQTCPIPSSHKSI